MKDPKNIVILGSTGSIGINALRVLEHFPKRFRVVGLSSFSNIELLEEQIKRFAPSMVCVVEPKQARQMKKRLGRKGISLFSTTAGLEIISSEKSVDIVVIAISGASAIYPLLASIKARKHICLANKESIVMAGDIIMERARQKGVRIVPVDSEHSAIFQCINSSRNSEISRIFLTGSGGPLYNVPKDKLSKVSYRQVMNHPKWKMGKKITVDSATLMNKGLEIIEAKHLFNIPVNRIELLIHPEAIVHSMVEFIDGSVIAQLGITDMRLPIQYALTYPERTRSILPRIDFSKVRNLSFYKPDMMRYPSLSLAMAAIKLGGTYPAVLNAADEIAVKAFLEGRISFVKILDVVEKVILRHHFTPDATINDILQTDVWAREEARRLC